MLNVILNFNFNSLFVFCPSSADLRGWRGQAPTEGAERVETPPKGAKGAERIFSS